MAIRKADIVRAEILRLMAEAEECGHEEELELLRKELDYLETHRSEY